MGGWAVAPLGARRDRPLRPESAQSQMTDEQLQCSSTDAVAAEVRGSADAPPELAETTLSILLLPSQWMMIVIWILGCSNTYGYIVPITSRQTIHLIHVSLSILEVGRIYNIEAAS